MRASCITAKTVLLKTRLLATTSGIVLCGLGWAASPAAAQGTVSTVGSLGVVTITAEKREENSQTVPIAVQAFSGDQLQSSGVTEITDIVKLSPNLNMVEQNALSRHIVIRGIGTNEFFGNAPSSVGTYMDEVTLNNSYMSTLTVFDMERVEVLRGPQNSLFGRNTTGGAVNFITKQPVVGAPMEGFGLLTYGSHNLMEIESGISFPLADEVALRIAGKMHRRDGIWHNLDTGDHSYGDEFRYGVRATGVWEPTMSTHVTLNFHHSADDSQAQPQKVTGSLANNPPLRINDTVPFNTDIDWTNPTLTQNLVNIEGFNRTTSRWNDVWVGGSQVEKLQVDGGYLKVNHDFGGVTLTSISSYDWTHALYEEDNTGNGNIQGGVNHDVLIIDMDQEYRQFTQEIRLASSDDEADFRWIVGAYYFNETSTLAQSIRFGANGFPGAHPSAVGITPPGLFDVIPNPYENTASFSIAKLRDRSMSVYGQADYKFLEDLTLIVGVRYTRDSKSNPSYFAGAFDKTGIDPSTYYDKEFLLAHADGLPACVAKTDPGYIPFVRCADNNTGRPDIDNGEIGGKVGLQYQINPDAMVYGSYSRGFKSGKFDVEFLHTDDTPFPQRPLKPETLDAFEFGFKSTLFDRTLLFNGAFFYNIWKNQQVFNVGVNGPEFNNLPESRLYGAEFELVWVPEESWTINAGLGLLHTEITDVTGLDFDLHQGDFQKGHALPLAPSLSINAGIDKSFTIGTGMLTVGSDLRYQSASKVKFSPQHPIDEYPSRFEMNAHVNYAFGEAMQYQLTFFANNLTKAQYCNEIQDLRGVSGSYYCVPNDGIREFGVQGRINF